MTTTAAQIQHWVNQHRELTVIAVDPGDEHVGLAWYQGPADSMGPYIIGTKEVQTPAVSKIRDHIDHAISQGWHRVVLVIEKFVLYPHSAGSQSWSPMLTSEMIGALKYIAAEREIECIEQGANIKKPIRQQLKARGIRVRPLPPGASGDHARDAELHLWHYLLRNGIYQTGAA